MNASNIPLMNAVVSCLNGNQPVSASNLSGTWIWITKKCPQSYVFLAFPNPTLFSSLASLHNFTVCLFVFFFQFSASKKSKWFVRFCWSRTTYTLGWGKTLSSIKKKLSLLTTISNSVYFVEPQCSWSKVWYGTSTKLFLGQINCLILSSTLFPAMITDVQLAAFANILGVSLFLLVVLYHFVAVNNPKRKEEWNLCNFLACKVFIILK